MYVCTSLLGWTFMTELTCFLFLHITLSTWFLCTTSRRNVSFIQFFLRFSSVLFRLPQFAPREENCTVLFCTFGPQFVCVHAAYRLRTYLIRTARTTEVPHLFEIVYRFLIEMQAKTVKQTEICVFAQCGKCMALGIAE